TRKPWLAILASAAVFSAIHMQFEGFFPRLLLGVLLGYLYVISKNIWLPILAHFINNASQVLLKYLADWANWDTKALEEAEISGLQAIASFGITVLLCRYLYVFYSRKENTAENRSS
ncbi:CPBP family intramembrane glutamic endopeptidase, partial [Arthrospira platensis SPKY1]|nr:CPBP family intramembrane glutamic endopeptidase [Arthrospira platensis SPKY1]